MSNKNNKIYSYLLLLISFFVLVLFTRGQFTSMQISLDEKEQAEINLVSARNEVSRLNEIESKLNESSSGTTSSGTISDIRANVNKYLNSITEDDIIDYIYSQIERDNKSSLDGIVSVRSISLQEEKVNEFGFKEMGIVLNLSVPNENRMYRILNFFIGNNSKYKFFIESFSYPNNSSTGSSDFNITIPLRVFYK